MSGDFFDYDPLTGITEFFSYDEEKGRAYIRSEQDVSAVLEQCHADRVAGRNDNGIRTGFWRYCRIPAVVQMELMAKGVDPLNPDHQHRLIAEINQNYPYLKTTQKQHA